eukprot:6208780-Amphidinium_carterae.2
MAREAGEDPLTQWIHIHGARGVLRLGKGAVQHWHAHPRNDEVMNDGIVQGGQSPPVQDLDSRACLIHGGEANKAIPSAFTSLTILKNQTMEELKGLNLNMPAYGHTQKQVE